MSSRSAFAPSGFSSTPVKRCSTRVKADFLEQSPLDFDIGVVSEDEDTFSLLSPIYHDSFDSGENCSQSSGQSSPKGTNAHALERCELPKTYSDQVLGFSVPVTETPSLSAWEEWLLNKTKQDQIKSEKKAEEVRKFQEKKKQLEKEHQQKVVIINQRIQDWLKMKREQDKQEQFKQIKEQEVLKAQKEKQKEIELKSQHKFKEWLQKKNEEKAKKQKKLMEEAAIKEEQEKERRRLAEQKFKEWLHQANTKNITNTKQTLPSPQRTAYPTPSFYNPIPWKPIHIQHSDSAKKASDRKEQSRPKGQRLHPVSRLQYAAQVRR